jgi:hypothetical protein
MNWELKLIALYYWVCESFERGAEDHAQRMAKNAASLKLNFTDQEAVTVYLFGILNKYKEVKEIHTFTSNYLADWFPTLPSYEKFNKRLNFLNDVFRCLANQALQQLCIPTWLKQSQELMDAVVDSMPIIMASGSRVDKAKVAREVADKGKCASKGIFYHGVKLHQLGVCQPGKLPIPQCLRISAASENDNTVFKEQIAPQFSNLRVFGDKIYKDEAIKADLKQFYNIEVYACQKRKQGQASLWADQKYFNTLVSKIRQPVESFFNWINQLTGIQIASKVRSLKGLFKHIHAKLTAALFILMGG